MKTQGIRIMENSLLARLAAAKLGCSPVAVTLGNTIHLHNTSKEDFLASKRWLRHEMAHVEQYRKYGFWKFLFLYLTESFRKGYYMNRFEVEARAAEDIL